MQLMRSPLFPRFIRTPRPAPETDTVPPSTEIPSDAVETSETPTGNGGTMCETDTEQVRTEPAPVTQETVEPAPVTQVTEEPVPGTDARRERGR